MSFLASYVLLLPIDRLIGRQTVAHSRAHVARSAGLMRVTDRHCESFRFGKGSITQSPTVNGANSRCEVGADQPVVLMPSSTA